MLRRILHSGAWISVCALLGASLTACGRPDDIAVGQVETHTAAPRAVAKGRVDVEGGVIQVAAARDGVIAEVLVEEGARVRKGQLLALQDARVSTVALLEAHAAIEPSRARVQLLVTQLDAARRELARLTHLAEAGAETTRSRDEADDRVRQLEAEIRVARAEVKAALARADVARLEVEQREIRAPIDGIIVKRSARPGTGASTLNVTSLFTVVPDTPKIVRTELEESFIGAVKLGQRVEIIGEADPSQRADGKVLRIAQVFGAKRGGSDDPNEKVDEHVVEVVTSLGSQSFLIGQRVRVNFKETS
jgi:HlyD family secretion protein